MNHSLIQLAESGMIPDFLIRQGIRQLLAKRLADSAAESELERAAFLMSMRSGALALVPEKANEQHYEVPPEFFGLVLGKHRKYSSAYYPSESTTLDAAEQEMLNLTIERAELSSATSILELGCGWGSLTLEMARRFPSTPITAVTNSQDQATYVRAQARERGLHLVTVIKTDMNEFSPTQQFSRIVSIEMFEHMRNYQELLRRVSSWLTPDGKVFVHIFCHQSHRYPFVSTGADDWMANYFFSGGLMPNFDIFSNFPDHLRVEESWKVDGTNYSTTSRHWLENLDRHRDEVKSLFRSHYGEKDAGKWLQRWRIFFMACEELFGYDSGTEWIVGHYRLVHSH